MSAVDGLFLTRARVAQLAERRPAWPEVADPAPRSISAAPPPARMAAQAFAAGLAIDPEARAAGYNAGYAGAPWRPAGVQDWLSYASGYFDGQRERTALWKRERADG